jgi:2-polyprenyl-6-methoxyphenol hydroxylase-like FAD-dependent oxidoreductase
VPRILIVGSGLAGLALAIGLGRQGLACEVVEREPAWAPVGAGIGLLPNAMRCLDQLGVGDTVRASGAELNVTEWPDATGGSTIRFDWRDVWDGHSVLGIHRHPLVRILADAVEGPVRLGTELMGLHQSGSEVDVRFSDGSTGAYDLVVGADGVYSTVRRLAFESAPPRYVGQHYWRGALADPDGVLPRHWWVARAPGRFFGLTPLGGELVYCFGQLNTDDLIREPLEGRLAHLRALFADFPGPALEALARLERDDQLHFGPVYEVTEPHWRAGRALLVGDAAHACSPIMVQGGAMAFEDALVLSALLGDVADAPERWDDVLDAFVARRRPRVEWVREQTHLRISQATAGPAALASADAQAGVVARFRAYYTPHKSPPRGPPPRATTGTSGTRLRPRRCLARARPRWRAHPGVAASPRGGRQTEGGRRDV